MSKPVLQLSLLLLVGCKVEYDDSVGHPCVRSGGETVDLSTEFAGQTLQDGLDRSLSGVTDILVVANEGDAQFDDVLSWAPTSVEASLWDYTGERGTHGPPATSCPSGLVAFFEFDTELPSEKGLVTSGWGELTLPEESEGWFEFVTRASGEARESVDYNLPCGDSITMYTRGGDAYKRDLLLSNFAGLIEVQGDDCLSYQFSLRE